MSTTVPTQTLEEMKEYYRARAAEYDGWWFRQGRFDRGAAVNERWFAEAAELYAALDALDISGNVLELAPGTGIWTQRLLAYATTITAVDAAPEMVAINRAKVDSERVSYILADLFSWQPDRQYDAVVFCFWISHVPLERLDNFLQTVAHALRPGGKFFFVDGRREPLTTAADHMLPEAGVQTMTRKLDDGRAFQIVKNYFDPTELAARFQRAGLEVSVRETPIFFIYGSGVRP